MASTPNYSSGVFTSVGTSSVTVSGECEVNSLIIYGASVTSITVTIGGKVVNYSSWAGAGQHALVGVRTGEEIALEATATTNAFVGESFPRYLKDGTVVGQTGGDSIVLSGILYT
jgi:hypothetical protein